MWNDTDDLAEGSAVSLDPVAPEENEGEFSIFFLTYNPNSPVFTTNTTYFGISISLLKFCIEGVGLTTLAALGIIGNILTIIVLSSPRMKSTATYFLTSLAFCDLIVLITGSLLIGVPSIMSYKPGEPSYFNMKILEYAYLVPMGYGLALTGLTGSVYFTLGLTLERYLVVCRPLYARFLCKWSRVCLVLGIWIFTIVYSLPRFWEYSSIEEKSDENVTIYRPVPTPFRTNPLYDNYIHVSYFALVFFVPICALIVLNVLIYLKIKEANLIRKNLSPSQKNEISLTRMLFGVVAVFLICQLSPAAHAIYRYIDGTRDLLPMAEFFYCVMLVLNSSVNFLIYCASGGKFREIFCDIFCFCQTSSKIRQFAASTKTTIRSFSSSSTGRSRVYSITAAQTNAMFQHEISPPENPDNEHISA